MLAGQAPPSGPDAALNFGQIGPSLDQFFTRAQALLGPKLGRTIPFVGSGLDDAATFFDTIASSIRAGLTGAATTVEQVKAGLIAGLGSGGLGVLSGDSVPDPVMTNTDPSDPDFEKVQFNLTLHKTLYAASSDILPFNLTLPGLGLSLSANVDVKLGYTIDLKFGVDAAKAGQFYVDVSGAGTTPDVTLDLEVAPHGLDTPEPELTANLGFLRLLVGDDPAKPSKLAGSIGIDLFDAGAGADGTVLKSEIASMGLTPTFKAGATAQLNLKFVTDFGSAALPSMEGDLNVSWGFDNVVLAPGTSTTTFGTSPNISINHVKVSLGEFFDKHINPIVKQIKDVLKPLSPILDVLGARMPVLSDIDGLRTLLDKNHDGKVTLIETIAHFEPGVPVDFIDAVITFNEIIGDIPSLDENAKIDLGGFSLNGPDAGKSLGVDVRTVPDLQGVTLLASKLFSPLGGSFDLQIQGQTAETRAFFQGAKDSSFDGGFRFPLLQDPLKALQLFLGKDVSLFTLDLPRMDFNFPFEGPSIPIIPPLFVTLRGEFAVTLDLGFGFDTAGLRTFATTHHASDIFEGFYVSDTANADGTGADVPEAVMSFKIAALAELNVVIVRIGVGGGIKAGIEFDLHDRGIPDGKIRPSEIVDDIAEGGIFGLFDMKGFLEAGLSAFVKVGFGPFSVEANFDIVSIRILDFDIPRASSGLDIQPATLDENGVLHLNVGPRALERIGGEIQGFPPDPKYWADTDEVMFVKHGADTPAGLAPDGTETVTVDYLGYSKTYAGVRSVVGDGGAGKDVLIVRPDVFVPVSLTGGDGDDKLVAGAGTATMRGGAGDDEVAAGTAAVALYGDDGEDLVEGGAMNDTLDGGAGMDTVFGSDGHDTMSGGDGIDAMMGGAGNDLLNGGNDADDLRAEGGDDTVIGEAGNDTVRGGGGNNLLFGGADNDLITAGAGADEVFGDAGDDMILPGSGNDSVHGGLGKDTVDAAEGDNTVYGDEDDDSLISAEGNDGVYGGNGADTIVAGAGADSLAGDAGNDVIFGDAGGDTIHGGAGNDELHGGTEGDSIYGEADNDQIYADDGADCVEGSAGLDTIYGNLGDDTISGGDDADTIYAEDGADSVHGDAGADSILGGEGADRIWGDAGNDTVLAGGADDTISGGDEDDSIAGEAGRDSIHGDSGVDSISGGSEDDNIYGDNAPDTIHGDGGADRIWGGTGADQLFGDAGADVLRGESEDDTISGGGEGDLVEGGAGNDSVSGDGGADRIYGGAGNDIVHGHAAGGAGDDGAADTAYGEAGNDQLSGEAGNDLLDGGAGVDTASGDAGNDRVVAGTGVGDSLLGGDGNDQIVGSDEGADVDANFVDATYFGDVIDGGLGDDTISALGGADSIQGGGGNDSVNSGQGRDLVRGGVGNDYLYAGRGRGDSTFGEAGNDTVYGSDEGADTISGGDDNDRIFGQGGADAITGDAGDDYVDVGGGTDTASGGAGNDEVLGGGGNLDSLSGDDGDDVLRGSDDGADLIDGGAGRDRAYGNGGNDTIAGGAAADTVDGGAGDDLISGDGGADLLIGGANHDVLYGHSVSGAGDDNAVDYVFGDFGTGANEAGGGRDQVFGQGGNDLLYGEGDDDLIDAGGGASNLVNYGSGEGANPADFAAPTPTGTPSAQPHPGITQGGATLPAGADYRGRWVQYASSASGPGLSGSSAGGLEPSVAVDAAGNRYVAWADARNGNYQVYIARYVAGSGWQEVAGSASEGGVSNTPTSSRRPSVAIGADGNPMVAWTEFTGGGASEIRVARYDPSANAGRGAWVAMGVAASGAAADGAVLMQTAGGPVVAYLDSGYFGVANAYVKVYAGGAWSGLGGAGFASGLGASAAPAPIRELTAATDGTRVGIAWGSDLGGDLSFREWSGAAWAAAESTGHTAGASVAPSLAFFGGLRFLAWQDDTSGYQEVYTASRGTTGEWSAATVQSNTQGEATRPKLAAGGGALHLAWSDDTQANRTGTGVAIFAKRYNGASFVAEVVGDASSIGLAPGASPDSVALAVGADGRPVLAWGDSAPGRSQVYVRANPNGVTGTVYTADASTGVQAILNANDLNAGDVIVVNGASAGFTVSAQDAGVTIVGSPGSSVTGTIAVAADDVTLQRVQAGAITVTGASRFTLRESTVGGVTLTGTTDAQVVNSTLASIQTAGGAVNAAIEHNVITSGIAFGAGGVTGVMVRDNTIGGGTGISIGVASSGTITGNDIGATGQGIDVAAAFVGTVDGNDVHGAAVGVRYAAAASLNRNRIHGNTTGVVASVAGNVGGFGFVNYAAANDIYANATGVSLTGRMQGQHVYANATGVTGGGVLGGDTLDTANLIESNTTGVANFAGPIQFNRVARNVTGVAAVSGQLVHHNLIYRNTGFGLRVTGKSDVRVVNNTFYAPAGDNVRVDGASSDVQLLNNVLWAEGGYDVYVADDSRPGFFSDYNTLHSTGAGKILHWLKDFNDVLDVQVDLALFDLNSVGRTAVNPSWAEPRFVNRAADDYRIFNLSAGQRFSSPTIDAASPITDLAIPTTAQNLLANGSFESGLTGWTASPGSATKSGSPAAFDGASYYYAGSVGAGTVEQTVNLTGAGYSASQLDSEDFALVFGGRVRTVDDGGQIVLTFLNASDAAIGTVNVSISNTTDRWELVGDRRQIPVGTRSVKFHFDATRVGGATNDTYLEAAFAYVVSENVAPDQGAYGDVVATEIDAGRAHVAVRSPDLYVDWDLSKPHVIRWDSYGNTADSPVRIDLYQDTADGPALVRTIAVSTADAGRFTWIPQNTSPALSAGTLGLRVQISYVTDNITLDRSGEAFAIPQAGADYFVNDGAVAAGDLTTAAGDNRATGKTAATPKPLLTTLLRAYDLGPADTVYVDAGNYQHFASAVISGNMTVNDDEGVTVTGPTDLARVASIAPLGLSAGAMFDLNDGDFVTLAHLTIGGLTNAVWARNASVNFTGSYLTTAGNAQDGIRIEADSTGAVLDHLDIGGSGRHGILAVGNVASIRNSKVYGSGGNGMSLGDAGPVVIENNDVFGNVEGIVLAWAGTAVATIGNADLSQGKGNKVHDNANSNISVAGNAVLVAGNSVSGGTVGIAFNGYGSAVANVVFDNYDGIRGGFNSNNRVYHNANAGITLYNGSGPATGNVVYSNGYGFLVSFAPNASSLDGPVITNNLIYASALRGVQLNGGRNARIVNNTIYQPVGDGIRVDPYASGNHDIVIRNNILAVGTDYAINVNVASQGAVTSDYNDFVLFGRGKAGFWSGAARNTLQAWRQASVQDGNGLSVDPLFVDIDGADNALGYQGAANDGRDDDFHLRSTVGSFHGGSFAPTLDGATGLPVARVGAFVADAATSPAIDRGDPADAFANEPAPNGAFIDLGAYGNTAQASKSAVPYVTVTLPVGGEIRPIGQSVNVKWRSQDSSGTVTIELWRQGGGVPVLVIAAGTANDGDYAWVVPAGLPTAADYFIRVTRPGPGPVAGDSPQFAIAAASNIYYVNDDAVLPGDVTTAVGNDANDGLTPSTPKASIAAVLNAYDLGAGDVITVDYGRYLSTNNIVVTNQDSGVVIRGPGAPSTTIGSDYQARVIADGPTHYYRLGEGAGAPSAADASGSGRTATYANGVLLGQPGAIPNNADTAASLDGVNDHVALPSGFASFPNGLSFEMWANPKSTAYNSRFFDLGTGQANSIVLARYGTSNDLIFVIVNGTTAVSTVIAPNAIELNRWQHFAVTMSAGGAVALYKNGVAIANGTVAVPANVTRTTNFIGRSNYAGESYYAGKFDEPAFYDKVLTPAQVKARSTAVLGVAVVDRGNKGAGAYAFELQNADNVTIDHLSITGGERGVSAGSTSDSDDLSITNNDIYANAVYGVYLDETNDRYNVGGNAIHDQLAPGYTYGTGVGVYAGGVISANSIHHNGSNGIEGGGRDNVAVTISGNDVYANSTGVNVSYSNTSTDGVTPAGYIVSGNTIHDNASTDLILSSSYRNSVASGNTVYGAPTGITVGGAAEAKGNSVYRHATGIFMNSGFATDNRVFLNTVRGIYAGYSSTVRGNRVYSNAGGIEGDYVPNAAGAGPYYYNNLVYANTNFGIELRGGLSAVIENNTVYQPTGDAFVLKSTSHIPGSRDVRVANNVFVATSGYAMVVQSGSLTGYVSDYNDVYVPAGGTGKFAKMDSRDFLSRAAWLAEFGLDAHSFSKDPQFVDPDGADDVLGASATYPIPDTGLDDDFHVRPTSPTIDAGDPESLFVSEPLPGGARAKQGNYGNTREAATSAAQIVQVLLPAGGERLDAGQQFTINWRSAGLTQNTYAALLNLGGVKAGDWKAGQYQVVAPRTGTVGAVAVDTSAVTNPAPQAVYQTYAYANDGVGNVLSYLVPVADGAYTLRLHWMEPATNVAVGGRVFDVKVNGQVVQANFDVRAAAGTYYKAVTLSIPVTAAANSGMLIELVNKTVNPAFLCGIEITAANPGGVAAPTANLDLSTDGGQTWTPIATNRPMDLLGRGTFNWTVPNLPTDNALIRVRANNGSQPAGISANPFNINAITHDFYIDPAGDNANSGRAANLPMASLSAILGAYDFGPGDVIHVAGGTYTLINAISIDTQDSGVMIQGPATGAPAIFNRGNTTSPVVQFGGGDDVTLDRLSLTGGSFGVSGDTSTANSDRITLDHLDVYGNASYGVYVYNFGTTGWTLSNSRVHDNDQGVEFNYTTGLRVTNNAVYNHRGRSITVGSSGGTISGNVVFNNNSGIDASSRDGADPAANVTVTGNTAYNNAYGVRVGSNVTADGNTTAGNGTGVLLNGGGLAGTTSCTAT